LKKSIRDVYFQANTRLYIPDNYAKVADTLEEDLKNISCIIKFIIP